MRAHAGFVVVLVLCVGRLVSSEVVVEVAKDSFPSCSLCSHIAQVAASTLQPTADLEYGLTSLMRACESYGAPTEVQRCSQFVEQFGLTVLDYLTSGEIPQSVCVFLSACSSESIARQKIPSGNSAPTNKAESTFLKVPVYQDYKADARCELCKFFVQLIDSALESSRTVATVKSTLQAICLAITDPTLKQLCQSLELVVLQLVESDLDPVASCQAANFCPASARYVVDVSGVAGLTCDTCNIILEELAISLNVVNEELESVCMSVNICPEDESQSKTFEPQLDSSAGKFQLDLQNTLGCELCELIITTADQYLKNNKSEAAINATIYKICNELPASFKPLCIGYAPAIVAALSNGFDPEKVCTEIKLCTGNGTVNENTQKLQKNENTLGCELCELVITTADQYLQNNRSEAAINATIYKICGELPAWLNPPCTSFAPQIVAALVNGLDPAKVCTDIKLCTGNGTAVTITTRHLAKLALQTDEENSLGCELCELVITTADQYLQNNKSEAAINATIYKICNELPASFKPLCLSFAPQIVAALAKGLDPKKVCTEVKLCTGNGTSPVFLTKLMQNPTREQEGTLECELCEFIISQADNFLKNRNFTPAEVNSTIFGLCNDLPISFQPFCDYYAKEIVQLFVNGVDPGKICAEIKLCSSANSQREISVRKSKAVRHRRPIAVENVSSFECDMCEFVVAQADGYLQNKNFTPAEANSTVYKLCGELPPAFQGFCYRFAPEIVTVLVNGVDPVKACTEIKLCTAQRLAQRKELQNKLQQAATASSPADKKVSGLECDICEFVIAQADAYLKNKNFTPAEVNSTVYQLCGELPPSFQSFCYQYAPEIVKVLVNGVDPLQACTEIKLCTSLFFSKSANTFSTHTVKSSLKCDVCEFVLNAVDAYLKGKNMTLAEANRTVFGICDQFPESYRGYCYSQAPGIVQFLVDGVDPKMICSKLNLCATHRVLRSLQSVIEAGSIECGACKILFASLDDDLYKDEDSVQHLLDQICHRLPPPTDKKCLGLVDPNFDALWEKFLSKVLSPDGICKLLKLC